MSIVIKGMEMPKRCFDCDLYDDENQFCKAQKEFMPMAVLGNYKDKDCPIVELPKKHGRLIDADELMNESRKDEAYGYVDTKQIYDAPTVIEAEGEG